MMPWALGAGAESRLARNKPKGGEKASTRLDRSSTGLGPSHHAMCLGIRYTVYSGA